MNSTRKHFVLYNNDGELMYEGYAGSHGSFLKQYIGKTKNKDLRNLNLRNFDFTGLGDLHHYDFEGSDFANAEFANMRITHSNFKNCKFSDTSFLKVNAENCKFDYSSFSKSNINFSNFDHCSFFGSTIIELDASRSSFTNADFNESNIIHSDFEKSKMMAATFINSFVKLTIFKDADLSDTPNHAFANDEERMQIYRDIESYLPDRTTGATFSDCEYEGAILSSNMKNAKWDRMLGKYAGRIISLLTIGAGAYAIEKGAEFGKEFIAKSIEEHANISSFITHSFSSHPTVSAAAIVLGIGAFTIGKEKTIDFVKDSASDLLKGIFKFCRNTTNKLVNTGVDIKNIAVLIANPKGSHELQRALQAQQNNAQNIGTFKAIKHSLKSVMGLNKDIGDIIICDRRQLGLALEMISNASEGKYSKNKDITLVLENAMNPLTNDGCSPSALIFGKDGSVKATWNSKIKPYDQIAAILYGVDGSIQMAFDKNNTPLDKESIIHLGADTKENAIEQFRKSLLNSPDLRKKDFTYDPEKSRIIAGRGETIFVENKKSGLIDNGNNYAVISPFINCFAVNGKLESKDRADTLASRREKRKRVAPGIS